MVYAKRSKEHYIFKEEKILMIEILNASKIVPKLVEALAEKEATITIQPSHISITLTYKTNE
ncbi:MAG: hypothetical protein DRN04_16925 [Thermoprotei archaeon]|nr:MAG: hypothetical protein DRN04_16925 [Thermoprotei archaeon]